MDTDIVVSLIGALASILIAWITTHQQQQSPNNSNYSKVSFVSVLALGLAITGLVVGLFSFSESRIAQLEIVKKTITAHTRGYYGDLRIEHYIAPKVEKPAKKHKLNISCSKGYKPLVAWHEITGSHPSTDTMYTVDPSVEDENVAIYLRARENATGYAYIEVFMLCSRL